VKSRIIKNAKEYKERLSEAEKLIARDPEPGTPDAERLELLALLIDYYEKKVFPIEKPGPVEAIVFRMQQMGLTQEDMVQYIGCRSKVSEVLSGKRNLSINMIRALQKGLGIPAEILLQETRSPSSSTRVRWNKKNRSSLRYSAPKSKTEKSSAIQNH
jgi:HTH-type transcriptional regulator / antitoxin HigA